MKTNAEALPVPFGTNFRLEQDLKGKPKQNHYLFSSEQNLDLNKT